MSTFIDFTFNLNLPLRIVKVSEYSTGMQVSVAARERKML